MGKLEIFLDFPSNDFLSRFWWLNRNLVHPDHVNEYFKMPITLSVFSPSQRVSSTFQQWIFMQWIEKVRAIEMSYRNVISNTHFLFGLIFFLFLREKCCFVKVQFSPLKYVSIVDFSKQNAHLHVRIDWQKGDCAWWE